MAGPVAPVDTSVVLPPSVRRASEAADAIHAQAYPAGDPPQPDPKPTVLNEDVGHEDDRPQPDPPPQPDPQPQPRPDPQPQPQPTVRRAPVPDSGEPGSWEHRFHSMKGRFDQSQETIGGLQEQMSEIGDELMRTQQALALARAGQSQPLAAPQTRPPARKAVTNEDVTTYGPELIDFVTRAARDAVAPEIQQVQSQVRQTNQKVTQTAQHGLYTALDEDVPDWREINVNPRFKKWCRSPDVYSGELRGKLLNAAFQAADAPRVVAFFKGFLTEEQATGQLPDPQGQPQPDAAPRTAAIPLDTLTAPGRAKPAGGDGPASAADKPVFTRAQITQFYGNVRRGVYAGREDEKNRLEQSIFVAQRDGRVR